MADNPLYCTYCQREHREWHDECEEFIRDRETAWRNRPKEPEPDPRLPVGYIHEGALKRLCGNHGVVAKCAFDYRLSQQANDSQTVALYIQGPVAPRVDVPTVEGFYWLHMNDIWTIEHVFKRPGHEYLCVQQPDIGLAGKRSFLAVEKLVNHAAWFGPITKPEV